MIICIIYDTKRGSTTFFAKITGKYIRNRYLKSLEKRISGRLVAKIAFRGWLNKPNYDEKKSVEKWVKHIIDAL